MPSSSATSLAERTSVRVRGRPIGAAICPREALRPRSGPPLSPLSTEARKSDSPQGVGGALADRPTQERRSRQPRRSLARERGCGAGSCLSHAHRAFHRAGLARHPRGAGGGKTTRCRPKCPQGVPLPGSPCDAGNGRTIAWTAHDDEFSSRDRSLKAKRTAERRRARCQA
jgi:hypothetical protein